MLGLVWSSLFGWLGILFDLFLRGFLWFRSRGGSHRSGARLRPLAADMVDHRVLRTHSTAIVFVRPVRWGTAISVRAGLSWIVIGLNVGTGSSPERGARAHSFRLVTVKRLMEFPNGRTALYDAGGMVGGASVARRFSQAVWTTGRSRLDAVIISHADGDHCNALPRTEPHCFAGWTVRPPQLSRLDSASVAEAIEQSAKRWRPGPSAFRGQSLVIDRSVSLDVLHPPHDFRSPHDNPNSIILSLEYAGRRIVLTGDLELEGLERLLKTPPLHADVLLSPHHGSLKANPPIWRGGLHPII